MRVDEQLTRITEQDEPESFIGRIVEFHARRYRIVEILGQGMEKIVFGLEDLADGSRERVFKIYRQRMDEAFKAQLEGVYQKLRDIGMPTADTEFHFIGDWLVEFEQRAAMVIHAGAEEAWQHIDPVYEECGKAAQRLDAGDNRGAWRIVEQALESHPMQPDLLYLGTLAWCRQGDVAEAGRLASQWVETGDEADQLADMMTAMLQTGAPRFAFALGTEGVSTVDNGLTIRRLMCDLAIDHFGSVPTAMEAREKLVSAGATAETLAEVDERIKDLAGLSSQLRQFTDPGVPGAREFAERAITEWPYEVNVNRLVGFTRYRAEQWAECISPLTLASSYDRYDPDIVAALGFAHLRVGAADKAHEWWGFWARILTDAARRILDEIAAPGPGRIEVEESHEAYVVMRRDIAVGMTGVIRDALVRLRVGGVSGQDCRQLLHELDELEPLLRQIPDLGPQIPD
jgi:hypothetical protein